MNLASSLINENETMLLTWRVLVWILSLFAICTEVVKQLDYFSLFFHNWAFIIMSYGFFMLSVQSVLMMNREPLRRFFVYMYDTIFMGTIFNN